ncbi:MAG: ATP-grasp domain-containing protein [Candidatus Burarchaeum sp.]|nr:ATP-grasp domain-containing protein [Candidatus Burarchaeum sp.]MDO8340053.1 ATP-grasp domain-containing protein [Candidatus Burarchaeum sp.]
MKKIGIWVPFRKAMTSVSYEQPGMLLQPVRDDLVAHLKKEFEVEEVEDFRRGTVVSGKAVVDGIEFGKTDAFVWFGEIGKDERRLHNLELLKAIEKETCVINCTHGYETAMDKYLTSSALVKEGIQVPRFALLTRENAEEVVEKVSDWKCALLKPRLGSYGIGIIKIDDVSSLPDYADYFPHEVHYIEEFIPNNPAEWIGINIIGGEHAYSYRKGPESFHGGWKVHDRKSVGGKMSLAQPTEAQLEIAKKIAESLGMAWCGVDIITDAKGKNYVVDVNAFPGLYPEMFGQAGVNGPEMMARAIMEKTGD